MFFSMPDTTHRFCCGRIDNALVVFHVQVDPPAAVEAPGAAPVAVDDEQKAPNEGV